MKSIAFRWPHGAQVAYVRDVFRFVSRFAIYVFKFALIVDGFDVVFAVKRRRGEFGSDGTWLLCIRFVFDAIVCWLNR